MYKLSGKTILYGILKHGFYHAELDKSSSVLCTFSSPFGYYRFKRLPFGVSLGPEYLQKQNFKNIGDTRGVQYILMIF